MTSWPWNRLHEFSLGQGSKSNFHMECPMSKCLGPDTGISYESVLSEMVRAGEAHRRNNCRRDVGYLWEKQRRNV